MARGPDFKTTQDDLRLPEDRAPPSIRLTDRYRLGQLLGEGGMGEVRACRDLELERAVALKLVRPEMRESEVEARFLREACVQGQLEHPSVVPVYDLGWNDENAAFFTMRKVEGITLDEVLRRRRLKDAEIAKTFTRHRLLGAFTKLCAAIDYAHSRGVLHRDLKPANVMLGEYGEVYLLDWGLAKLADLPALSQRGPALVGMPTTSATQVGEALGTPAYMAPEQLAGQEIDGRADVFALGAILFEILTLQTLFDEQAVRNRLKRQSLDIEARPSARGVEAPPELDRICVRATAVLRDERYPTVRALHDAVEAFLAGERDVDLRATLASAHLVRAESLAKGSPKEAMREVNRALALSPEDARALELLGTLFQRTSEAPSAQARAEVVSEGIERLRRTQPIGALLYGIAWVTLYPIAALYRGVWNVWMALLPPAVWLLASIAILVDWKQKSQERVRYPTFMVMLAIALTSLLFGPLLVVPGLAVTSVASHILVSARHHRRYQIVVGGLATLLPALLAWFGLVDTFRFDTETTFALRGVFRTMRPLPASIGLTAVDVVLLAGTAFFATGFRDEIERARRASGVFAWQLRHLFPAARLEGRPKVADPITDPLRKAKADAELARGPLRSNEEGFATEIDGEGVTSKRAFSGKRYQQRATIDETDDYITTRVHDRLIGREVALKRPKSTSDERFRREPLVLARLDHPGVPPLYDLGVDEQGRPWFTSPLLTGTTLEGAKERGRHRLLVAFAQVCLTIELAHTRGIVHSALEPRCIVLGDLGEVFVGSWSNADTRGIADAAGALALPAARTNGIRGYAAPEQAGGALPDARSDVFALGAILFEVLAEVPLFGGDRTETVLGRYDARPSSRRAESGANTDDPIPPELDAICVRATAYDAADRYATARELFEAIDAYLARDRDEALSKALADKSLARAKRKVAKALAPEAELADREAALDELGRSLALARDRGPALAVLEELLASPPTTIPADVARELDAQGLYAARQAAPILAATVAIVWLGLFPVVALLLGVRDLGAAIVVAVAWGVAAFALYAQHVLVRTAARFPWSAIAGLVAVSATSLLFGPHILVPSGAIAMTMGFLLGGRLAWRKPVLVLGVLAMVVPAVLGLAGVLDAFAFQEVPAGSAVTMTGVLRGALKHPPDAVFVGLSLANVVAVLVAATFAGRFRDVLEDIEAQNRAKIHALKSMVER